MTYLAKLLPIVILMLIMTMAIITFFFIKNSKIFLKALFIYMIISGLVILIFTLFYLIVFVLDMQNFKYQYPNGFSKLNISSVKKQQIIDGFLHIKGINFIGYYGKPEMFFLDLFYFSSMTYFTVGYGDISAIGIVRIIPIIESAIGVGMTGIIISMILNGYSEMSKKEDVLRMFISRGYDILFFQKPSINEYTFLSIFSEYLSRIKSEYCNKDKYNIYLVDNNCKVTKILNIKLSYESKETFSKFKIAWNFNNYENRNLQYYKFAQYLKWQLRYKLDGQFENQLYKFAKVNEKIDLLNFQVYLVKLRNFIWDKYKNDDSLDDEISELIDECINSIEENKLNI